MKKYDSIICVVILMGCSFSVHAADLISHDFDDGNMDPWYECTTKSPNYTRVENGRMVTWWTETGYDGTRSDKGAEACADWNNTRKEGWMGFTMNLGADYPTDKNAGVAQIFQFYSDSFWSWAAMLRMYYGDLSIIHRSNGGSSSNIEVEFYPDFPKETDMDIIIHFIVSHENNGLIQIWVNGVSRYVAENINFGYAEEWTNDEQTSEYSYIDLKIGQYNYDDSNYDTDETRTVYYDNVSWYNGSDGYSIVDPAGANNIPYGDSPRSIPGRIEAEEYDLGGEGVAYHDTTAGNTGGQFRLDDVDITVGDGGYIVGWTPAGEWLEYTVNASSGTYALNLRVATPYAGRQIVVTLDGVLLKTIDLPNTGSWTSFQTVTVEDVSITGGSNQVLRVGFPNGNINMNWFQFILPVDGDLTFDEKVNMEDVAELSAGWQSSYTMDDLLEIAANWLNGTMTNTVLVQENETGYCGADGTVDNNNAGFTGVGFVNTTNAVGRGVDWSVDGAGGWYTITWRYAVEGDARAANLHVNGSIISSDIPFATTGRWTTWTTQTVHVTLGSGIKSVRLEATGSSGLGNIDYMEVTGPDVVAMDCN